MLSSHCHKLLAAGLLLLLAASPARGLTVSAYQDQSCPGTRINQDLNCSANDFTAAAAFSAAPGQPSFCVNGQPFELIVNLGFTSLNTTRYDIGYFSSQDGSDILKKSVGNVCSVATFHTSPAPWANYNGNTCGDFAVNSTTNVTVDTIKVLCQGDALGNLLVPYVITYGTLSSSCTDYSDVAPSASSKCISDMASVSDNSGGNIQVFAGAYVDIKKATSPGGDNQPFSFTATAGDVNAKVSVGLVDSFGNTPSVPSPTGNSATYNNLMDGQTIRFFINLPSGSANQTLTIVESATTFWEPSAAISCAQTVPASGGTMSLVTNTDTRTIIASDLNSTNVAAACTVNNYKRSKITMVKEVAGRINAGDDFRVRATGGGNLTDDAGVAIAAPVDVDTAGANGAQTVFWSSPGQTLSFTDSATSGTLDDYTSSYACTNQLTGSTTPMPSGDGSSFDLLPGYGDDITCTFTNSAKPTLSKAFDQSTIGVEMPATLTFTLANPSGAPARSGLSFTDTLPASPGSLVVAATPNLATSGCGGSPDITATAGSGSIVVNSVEVGAGAAACTISVDVTASTAGSYVNGAAAITAISSQLRNGVTDQTIAVRQAALSKGYDPPEVYEGGSTTLTFTLANGSGNPAQANLSFTDTLATGTGLTITGVTALSGSGCSATTPTFNASGNPSVTLTGASMDQGSAACSFTVTVTGNTAGSYPNTGASVSAASNPVNAAALSATLTVSRLSIGKAFVPDTVDVYEPSALTFTLDNSSPARTLSGVSFTDVLNGFYVRSVTIGGTCAGVSNFPALAVGATSLDLTVPSMPPGSCTITIPVSSSLPGSYDNTTSAPSSNETGVTGVASNTATLTVNRLPLVLTKVASGGTVAPGSTVDYSIGYSNPNAATPFLEVEVSDPLPPFTTFVSASCGPLPATITSCDITAPAAGGTGTVTWTLGGSLDAGSSGTVYLRVLVQ